MISTFFLKYLNNNISFLTIFLYKFAIYNF